MSSGGTNTPFDIISPSGTDANVPNAGEIASALTSATLGGSAGASTTPTPLITASVSSPNMADAYIDIPVVASTSSFTRFSEDKMLDLEKQNWQPWLRSFRNDITLANLGPYIKKSSDLRYPRCPTDAEVKADVAAKSSRLLKIYQAFQANDEKARTLICQNISMRELSYVQDAPSASKMIDILEERHTETGLGRQADLFQTIFGNPFTPDTPVSQTITTVVSAARQVFESAPPKDYKELALLGLIFSLGPHYADVKRSLISSLGNALTIGDLEKRLNKVRQGTEAPPSANAATSKYRTPKQRYGTIQNGGTQGEKCRKCDGRGDSGCRPCDGTGIFKPRNREKIKEKRTGTPKINMANVQVINGKR